MSKKLAIAFGLLLLLPVAAQASIADVFQQLDHGTVDDKNFVRTLIVGIEDGFSAVNDELNDNGKPMLYCVPENNKFTSDQLIDILRRWLRQIAQKHLTLMWHRPQRCSSMRWRKHFPARTRIAVALIPT